MGNVRDQDPEKEKERERQPEETGPAVGASGPQSGPSTPGDTHPHATHPVAVRDCAIVR